MSLTPWYKDLWRIPTFALWCCFFCIGFVPEWTYWLLRYWGDVNTYHALINSDYLITLALTAFFAHFVFQRAREAGLPIDLAWAKSLQCALLALAAFIPAPFELFLDYQHIIVGEAKRILLVTSIIKIIAWTYLLSLLLRYYFGQGAVFIPAHGLAPHFSGAPAQSSADSEREKPLMEEPHAPNDHAEP